MKLEVNISKKTAIPIIASILVLASIITVFAFGTSTPTTMGHSLGEIAPPAGCGNNEVLSWSSTGWDCVPQTGGSGLLDDTVACIKVWTPPFGGPGAVQYNTISVPSICKESKECVLIAHNGGWSSPIVYRQIAGATGANPNNPRVWYSLGASSSGGVNGETSSQTILSKGLINLYDDLYSPGTYDETNPDKWVITNGPQPMDTSTDGLWACS